MYEPRTTQENQILDLLTERKGAGVYSYELAEPRPRGCGILQYNARIFGLRHKGHNIVSDHKGHYILQEEHESMTQEELNKKLADLKYDFDKTGSPGMKKLIEIRINLLKKQFAEQDIVIEPPATPEDAERIVNVKAE